MELYDHQILAISKLKNGSILCGGVGTGKSRTALAYYFEKECNGHVPINGKGSFIPMRNPKKLYIITTARKRDTLEWDSECIPFLLSDYVVDSWNNIGKYASVCGAFFIFDEQRVVGSGAWVKAFLQITKRNHWILLSATPGDTWIDYIPVFIANGFYKNRTQFIRTHVIFNRFTKYPKIDRYVGEERLRKLRESILVNMEFVKKTVSHDEIVYTGYDQNKYIDILRNRWNPYTNQPIKTASELCYSLRQVVNSGEQRVEAVKELVLQHPKVIIFYNFDYELDILRQLGKDLEIQTAEWNGHKHQPIPEKGNWIYLVQYTAGAEGWNCVQTNAIVFFSQNYSYKITTQAAGRIDRLNTPFTDLYYYHVQTHAPIDIAIYKALKQKQNFNELAFVSLENSREKHGL